jgi:hypothetical protein
MERGQFFEPDQDPEVYGSTDLNNPSIIPLMELGDLVLQSIRIIRPGRTFNYSKSLCSAAIDSTASLLIISCAFNRPQKPGHSLLINTLNAFRFDNPDTTICLRFINDPSHPTFTKSIRIRGGSFNNPFIDPSPA